MMRYRLRTLLILVALLPPLLAAVHQKAVEYQRRQNVIKHLKEIGVNFKHFSGGQFY